MYVKLFKRDSDFAASAKTRKKINKVMEKRMIEVFADTK